MGFDDFDAQLQSEDFYLEDEYCQYTPDELDFDLIRDANEEPPPEFYSPDDDYPF